MIKISGVTNHAVFLYLLQVLSNNDHTGRLEVENLGNEIEIHFPGTSNEDIFYLFQDLCKKVTDAEADVELVLKSYEG